MGNTKVNIIPADYTLRAKRIEYRAQYVTITIKNETRCKNGLLYGQTE